MPSILFEERPKRNNEPMLVALYSIVPGVGQLHNGKTTKGIIFLVAAFISLLMLYASFNPASTLDFALTVLMICKFFFGFIFKFDIHPSPAVDFLMDSIKFGGSFSQFLMLTIAGFVMYSMFDAYMDAEKAQQRFEYNIINTDTTRFRFSESAAGSYILHSLIISLLFLSSLFLVIPTKKEQITEIEFILPQVESKKPPPPEIKRRSTVQSIDQGKHIPTKPVSPPQLSKPTSPPPALPKQVQQRVVAPPQPIAPQPMIAPAPVPRPVPKVLEKALTDSPKPAPVPISNIKETTNDSASVQAPSPESISQQGSEVHGTITSVIPKVPGIPGRAGLGEAGNPPPNARPYGTPSIAAKRDIDFGPYMEQLQRKIKQAWRPPRGNESKRVIVIFMIGRAGDLSDLMLKKSSGFEPSDKAALLAIQNAAPFARLPEGAPNFVDIEFTFDYNVFGSAGSYRRY